MIFGLGIYFLVGISGCFIARETHLKEFVDQIYYEADYIENYKFLFGFITLIFTIFWLPLLILAIRIIIEVDKEEN